MDTWDAISRRGAPTPAIDSSDSAYPILIPAPKGLRRFSARGFQPRAVLRAWQPPAARG